MPLYTQGLITILSRLKPVIDHKVNYLIEPDQNRLSILSLIDTPCLGLSLTGLIIITKVQHSICASGTKGARGSAPRLKAQGSDLSSSVRLAPFKTQVESQNDGEFGDLSAKIKMQTTDQQRNVLRMLEKSLAKEMELEKKLSESRNAEYQLEIKLYSAEQEVLYMEEVIEDAYSKWLEAENASEVFKGVLKEMSGKLQILKFNLSGSFKRGDNLNGRLEAKESALHKLDSKGLKESLKEVEERLILLDTKNSTLSDKVSSLEEQLNDNDDLKDKLVDTEARADEAESKCLKLEESLKEVQDELECFRGKGFTPEKLESLEKRLRDYDHQLELAVAAVEARKEKQNLLYSTVSGMEDNRANYTEEKLNSVSESNADLNEELKFCRGRLKKAVRYLEKAEERKSQTAKDIAHHNKIMKKLVMQLASERERLHKHVLRHYLSSFIIIRVHD
ncbi:unnamed protein product [Eruca vesicaria subsp. sativa]|uniref:Uncharacterized protein n=1 Tax=Eruca vesicaria subsp. sativa TaxID=29727 RepID=A0ABC8LN17_ERUVS|nr:unnamed protein product [Eruca vesicaria subsp. sativa]